MGNAVTEEDQAMHLQKLANEQFDQEKTNKQVLNKQEAHLAKVVATQKDSLDKAKELEDTANQNVMKAEQQHKRAMDGYTNSLSTQRYINEVRIPVAKEL